MDKFVVKKRKGDEANPDSKVENNDQLKKLKSEKIDSFDDKLSVTEVLQSMPIGANDEEAEKYFEKLSNFLMNEVVLVVNGKKHAFRELEYYWTTPNHPDPFTHHGKVQETCGFWYFHKTGTQYRSGTYKGLDISIGKDDKHYGGILIRSIEVLGTGEVVCGPCKCVDHILSVCKTESINNLVDEKMKGEISIEKSSTSSAKSPKKKSDKSSDEEGSDTSDKKPLYLERRSDLVKNEIHRSPRVGLYMTKKNVTIELQSRYVFKFYRYFALPRKIAKGKHYMVVAFHHQGMKPDEIARSTGSTTKSISKWIDLYKSGIGSSISLYSGKLSDDQVCSGISAILSSSSTSSSSTITTTTKSDNNKDEDDDEDNNDNSPKTKKSDNNKKR